MTVYVCGIPYDRRTVDLLEIASEMAFHMWADSDPEALGMAYAVGAEDRAVTSRAWPAYSLTPEQFAAAVTHGATVTDFLGPAIWYAERVGNWTHLAFLTAKRACL